MDGGKEKEEKKSGGEELRMRLKRQTERIVTNRSNDSLSSSKHPLSDCTGRCSDAKQTRSSSGSVYSQNRAAFKYWGLHAEGTS